MHSTVGAGDGLGDRDVPGDGIGLGVGKGAGEGDGLGAEGEDGLGDSAGDRPGEAEANAVDCFCSVESDFAFPTAEQPISNTASTMRENSKMRTTLRPTRK
jgi:hypothetical protein